MDNNNTYFEIPLKKNNLVVAKQKISVGSNNSFCFQQQGKTDSIIKIDAQNKKLILNNAGNEFANFFADKNKNGNLITIDISKISASYNQDFTFVVEENGEKCTYKITPFALQQKLKGEKKFVDVCRFENPLDVTLPNDLPNQLSVGNLEMKEFPSQMFEMFKSQYGYSSFQSAYGKLNLLKSPNNEILISRGTKIIKPSGFEYFKKGQDYILAVKLTSSKGVVQGKETLGIAYTLTEQELKNACKFIENKELADADIKDKSNVDIGVDFKRTHKIREATKNIDSYEKENSLKESNEEIPNETDNGENKEPILQQPNEEDDGGNLSPEKPNQGGDGISEQSPKKPSDSDDGGSKGPSEEKPSQSGDAEAQHPTAEKPIQNGDSGNKEQKPTKADEKSDADKKADADKKKKQIDKKTSKYKKRVKLFIKLFIGLALLFLSGATMLGAAALTIAPVLGFFGLFSTFMALGLSTYAQTDLFANYTADKGFFSNFKENIKALKQDKANENTPHNSKQKEKNRKKIEKIQYKKANGLTEKQLNKYYSLLNKQQSGQKLSNRQLATLNELSFYKENKLTQKEQIQYNKLLQKSIQEKKLSKNQTRRLDELLLKQNENTLTQKEQEQLEKLQNPLTQKEQEQLHSLQFKKQNAISIKEQNILDNNIDNMSKDDMKSLKELTSKVENYEPLTKDEKISLSSYTQTIADNYDEIFEKDRQEYLSKTRKQIVERQKIIEDNEELLKNNQTPFLTQDQVETLNKEIESLKEYGKQVAELKNPNFEDNNKVIDHIAADETTIYTHKDLKDISFMDYKNSQLSSPKSFLGEKNNLFEAQMLQKQNLLNNNEMTHNQQ